MRTKRDNHVLKLGFWFVVLNVVSSCVNAAYGNPAVAVFNVVIAAILVFQLATFPE